jgi:hypothetical protein
MSALPPKADITLIIQSPRQRPEKHIVQLRNGGPLRAKSVCWANCETQTYCRVSREGSPGLKASKLV